MATKFKNIKDRLSCNSPVKSTKEGKKKMVKACQDGEEKLIHFGASDYKSNYSAEARKNFRARHNCDTANDKLTARHWACKALWSKNSPVYTRGKGGKK
jgi:hypothetical protein